MTKIKICGITNLEDALNAAAYGADALGFIFYPKSPRYIKPQEAKEIIKLLPPLLIKVGVFVNEDFTEIERIRQNCGLQVIQLHGEETPADCKKFSCPVIKGFRIKDKESLALLPKYKIQAYLMDTFHKDKLGGTGEVFDWRLALQAKKFGQIILAGGLNPENVLEAIRKVKPYAVDVSSGVEKSPGIKDKKKMREFIEKVKGSIYPSIHGRSLSSPA